MEMPNRHQRRAMAKAGGYFKMKKNSSKQEREAIAKRAAEVGKKIHLANVERNLRAEEERAQQREQAQINKLIEEGHSPEEALKIIQRKNESLS